MSEGASGEFTPIDLGTAFAGAAAPSGVEAIPELSSGLSFDTTSSVDVDAGSLNGDSSVHENADAAVQYNTTINDASTQLAQAVFAELYGPQSDEGDEDGGAPAVTQRARDEAEKAKAEKQADLAEAQEQAAEERREAKEAEDRAFQDFLNSTDFEKLTAYYAGNPDMLDKVRDRLVDKGTSPSKAEKGAKEFQEFIDLKKKEKEGTLTPKDQERLTQIKKSEEFKTYTQAAREVEQRRNDKDLATNGATTKEIGREMDNATLGVRASSLSVRQKISFESYSDPEIKAEQITTKYNMVASANKIEIKTPEVAVANANVAQIKIENSGMAAITV